MQIHELYEDTQILINKKFNGKYANRDMCTIHAE